MLKRYLIEFGTGVDIHGGDCTKAGIHAVKDAISHCCMCGLSELLNFDASKHTLRLEVKIASPKPSETDGVAIRRSLPGNGENATLEVVSGGHVFRGMHVPEMGEGDQIVMVNASISVFVDLDA